MIRRRTAGVTGTCALVLLSVASCNGKERASPPSAAGPAPVAPSRAAEEFKAVFEDSGEKLLLIELYADWCKPCRTVSSTLAQVAAELGDGVVHHRVDVAELPDVAARLGGSSLPYVVFAKKGEVRHALPGIPSRDTVLRTIRRLTGAAEPAERSEADGTLVEGVREIELQPAAEPGEIYVYRGDTVKLIVRGRGFPYSVHIPALKASGESKKGEDIELKFKAREVGTYAMFCNGDCPAGDGAAHATLVVMQYKGTEETVYAELSAKEAKALIDRGDVLVLDVRTPMEFYDGHLKGAKLIPVQQLYSRASEIEGHKNKDILLYCRSGNRSTVAAEILRRHGFRRLHNMRYGIRDWLRQGYETVR
jgi:rhodanese-related sulfurtransferase/plastocyanin